MDDSTVSGHLIEISNKLGSLEATLKATNDKIDLANQAMATHANNDSTFQQSISTRVAVIETSQSRFKWMAGGGAALFVGIAKAAELWFYGGGKGH